MRPITARFKDAWKVNVTVTDGGRDQWGDPLEPGDPVTIEDCLFAPTSSTEGQNLSQVPDDRAKLLTPPGHTIPSTAAITVPGHGTYAVEGTPDRWPLGTSVQLTRKGARPDVPDDP